MKNIMKVGKIMSTTRIINLTPHVVRFLDGNVQIDFPPCGTIARVPVVKNRSKLSNR